MIECFVSLYLGNEPVAVFYAIYVVIAVGVLLVQSLDQMVDAGRESNQKNKQIDNPRIYNFNYEDLKSELEDELRSVGITIKGNALVFEQLENLDHYSAMEIQEQRDLLVSKYISIIRNETIRTI